MKTDKKTFNFKWAGRIFLITFAISSVLSGVSEGITLSLNIAAAVGILLLFICIGIIFDIFGTSVTAADITVFNSMAARRVKGSAVALRLVSKADAVANFCNDVIGDISGVLSGTMCLAISGFISTHTEVNNILITVVISSFTSATIVCGKALGKNFALKNSESIVFFFSKILCVFVKDKKNSRK